MLRFAIQRGIAFFPMTLIMEGGGRDIKPGRAYVIGERAPMHLWRGAAGTLAVLLLLCRLLRET